MLTLSLATSVFLALVSAFVYIHIGNVVRHRALMGPERDAITAFACWWYGLAGLNLSTAVMNPAAALGVADLHLMVALLLALLLVICLALWGLTYYLAYLFTGRAGLKLPLAIAFGSYYLWITYLVMAANPIGYTVGQWGVQYDYEHQTGSGVSQILTLLLLGPALIGSIGYLLLFFRVHEPMQRYRIAMVAASITVWFGTSIVASLTGFNHWEYWPLMNRLVSLSASLVVLAAYQPPVPVKRWLASKTSKAVPAHP